MRDLHKLEKAIDHLLLFVIGVMIAVGLSMIPFTQNLINMVL